MSGFKVFLAGSIEMGKAKQWQQEVVVSLTGVNVTLLNPRRDNWDSSWDQEYDDDNAFTGQVKWELSGLEKCDKILMYFDPGTTSPISLLELGLQMASGKLFVVCPEGFYRKGNVEITCDRYGVPYTDNLQDGIDFIRGVAEFLDDLA